MNSAKSVSVAMDMTFPRRNTGGTGVYANALLAELKRRNDVNVYEIAGPIGGGPIPMLNWLAAGARSRLQRLKVALLHCPAFVAPWRSPVPLVITTYDAAGIRFPDEYPLEWRLYSRYFLPARLRAADRVIVPSRFAAREVARFYGVSAERISVTEFAPALEQPVEKPRGMFPQVPASVRPAGAAGQTYALQSAPTLLFVGSPLRRKNLDVLLQAMHGADPKSPVATSRLLIVGARAESFPSHVRTIQELGLSPRVSWLGHVSDSELACLYDEADLLVYPSMYEGFGLPPLEAMVAGTPVIASSISVLHEILGDAALYFPPRDSRALAAAIEALLTRPQLRQEQVARGRKQASRYTWAKCADETCRIYGTVLGTG